MKILAYNINLSSQEKIDKVLRYDADVNILPEVACQSRVKLPEGYRMEWMGDSILKGWALFGNQTLIQRFRVGLILSTNIFFPYSLTAY